VAAHGLQDLVTLVINRTGEQTGIDAMEDFHGPILQDTEDDDVFGSWGAASYDLYVVDRAGRISYAESGAHPADDPERFIEVLSGY
jgi:hypothetical protein